MKAWKKGAIVGAIWGPLSGIYLFLSGICGFAGSCPTPHRPFLESIIGQIFIIPMRGSAFLHTILIRDSLVGNKLNLILPLLIFPPIIGALLIGGVVYLIGRWRSPD